MDIVKSLTPKDTEEIKPGLFIQKRGDSYRQILPMAWDGKLLWKEQLRTIFSVRTVLTIAIMLFLAWAYVNDNGAIIIAYNEIVENPDEFCNMFPAERNEAYPMLNLDNITIENGQG